MRSGFLSKTGIVTFLVLFWKVVGSTGYHNQWGLDDKIKRDQVCGPLAYVVLATSEKTAQ